MKRIIFCLVVFLLFACNKTHVSTIPNFPVYLELDLTYEDKDLIRLQAHKIYTHASINQYVGVFSVGFGGVLVYHGIDTGSGEYFAFDAACPFEANRSTLIEVESDEVFAVCPKCNSKFELLNGIGNPVSGPANDEGYYLKKYAVTHTGNKLIVRDN